MKDFTVSIVIPCFNEQNNIPVLTGELTGVLSKYNDYEILFIDDGSTDDTLSIIKQLSENNERIKYVSFSRNFGHQYALKAGIDLAKGDCVISLDADLQHPVSLLDQMIQRWQEGFDLVLTVREEGPNTSFFKRKTATMFYRLINSLSDIDLEKGSADFRLMDRAVVEVFKQMKESSLFMRGLVSWVGFKRTSLQYMPHDRLAGTSKYSLSKMLWLALDGIISFSIRPLHVSIAMGTIISLLSFGYGIYAIIMNIFYNKVITGWTSLIVSLLFLSGVQLLMIGILGEYVGKLFMESKKRPSYIIKEKKL
jgi:polyisoprenyl-phosphate glycosyltransferase